MTCPNCCSRCLDSTGGRCRLHAEPEFDEDGWPMGGSLPETGPFFPILEGIAASIRQARMHRLEREMADAEEEWQRLRREEERYQARKRAHEEATR